LVALEFGKFLEIYMPLEWVNQSLLCRMLSKVDRRGDILSNIADYWRIIPTRKEPIRR
jgi:hypothetical protein